MTILSVDIPQKDASRSNWSCFPASAVLPKSSMYCGECDCCNYDLSDQLLAVIFTYIYIS